MSKILCGFFASIALLSIAGCNREPAPVAKPDASNVVKAPAEVKVDTATCAFCAEPATVRECEVDKGLRTKLHWHQAAAGVTVVGVYVVDENDGKEKPFAEHEAEGSIETGPWLRPGLVFRLRDSRDGSQLGEVTIAGIPCES